MMNKRTFLVFLILIYLLTNLPPAFAANSLEIQNKGFMKDALIALVVVFVALFFGGIILIMTTASLQTRKSLLSFRDFSIEKIERIEEQRKKAILKTLKIFATGGLIIILVLIILFVILWFWNIKT